MHLELPKLVLLDIHLQLPKLVLQFSTRYKTYIFIHFAFVFQFTIAMLAWLADHKILLFFYK